MNFRRYFIVGILCLCTIVSGKIRPLDPNKVHQFELDDHADEQKYRLPTNTKPETYDITIQTAVKDMDFNFNGTVKISVMVLEPTSTITLHARQLNIKNNIKLTHLDGGEIVLKQYNYQSIPEFLVIETESQQLEKDKNYILTIEYSGVLREDNSGFYRSSYIDSSNMQKWLATTQFESTDARHGFPCYDEPSFKANFTIHIIHDESYNAISNTNGTREQISDYEVKTSFATTPPTSTYLIAFIVSDFKYIEKKLTGGNPSYQRVYTSENKLRYTEYALDEGVKILDAISKYVSVPYSLSKMDQAAIPNFRSGAMENWGLVTYRESKLFYDQSVHSPSQQLIISNIIAHEFGHQWFGNLVSPRWWTYIWLNEGFATLFEYLGAGLVHPDWNIFNYFVVKKLQPALYFDATPDTRAMTTYVESPNGIAASFDTIAYGKSGSVIRMFLHALGEGTFKKGIELYLTTRAYDVADENDLFDSLNQAAKEDKAIDESLHVKDLFGSWSNQKGFPLLKVTRNENGSVSLYQEKYNSKDESNASTWWIPFNFATKKDPEFNATKPFGWLAKGQSEILIAENNEKWTKDDWLIFNLQATGFYRVLYDENNYKLINNQLHGDEFEKIHEINRAQYIDDLNDLASTNRVEPKILFNALTYLKKESKYAPWVSAQRSILNLRQIFAASKQLNRFNEFISNIITDFYTKNKLTNEPDVPLFDQLSRNIAVDLACQFNVSDCLNETYTKFHDFIKNNTNKPLPHVRSLVFAYGIRSAESQEIVRLWTFFKNTNSDEERHDIIASLRNIQDATQIELYLNKTLENLGTKVTQADRVSIIQSISGGSQTGLSLTIKFLQTNLDNVNTTIGSVPSILISIGSKIVTSDVQNEFVALLDLAKSKNLITDSQIATLKANVNDMVNWQDKNLSKFEDALPEEAKPNSATQMIALPTLLVLMFGLVRWMAE